MSEKFEFDKDPNTYTVKEILTQFVMPALEELRRQQDEQVVQNEQRFRALESAKNRGMGAILLLTVIVIPIAIPVVQAAAR